MVNNTRKPISRWIPRNFHDRTLRVPEPDKIADFTTLEASLRAKTGHPSSRRRRSSSIQSPLRYGIDRNAGHYEIDHLIPLGIGGADSRENLWPESWDTQPWNAGVKDKLENYLHVEVCAGQIAVLGAQKAIAADWVAAYRKYLGAP